MAAYLQQRQDRMAKLRASVNAEQDRELTFRYVLVLEVYALQSFDV
jgi:hypothetical protein